MATAASPTQQVFLVRNPATVPRVNPGQTLVVPICAGIGDMEAVYTFNGLGAQLWHLLQESLTEENLIAWLMQNFEVDPEVRRDGVRAFLDDLKQTGLVTSASLPEDVEIEYVMRDS